VQCWSNGGITVLVTISERSPGLLLPSGEPGFRAAIAEYPGCGTAAIKGDYRAYAPILMMLVMNYRPNVAKSLLPTTRPSEMTVSSTLGRQGASMRPAV